MPTPEPASLDTAIEAAAVDMHERSTLSMHRCRALSRDVLRAALPHLLPGLYVAPLETDHGKPCIWVDDPDHPGQPVPLMTEQEHPRLFAILAALLPDRTEDEEE